MAQARTVKVVEGLPKDFNRDELREGDSKVLGFLNYQDWNFKTFEKFGPCYSILVNGKWLAFGGYYFLGPGVADVWQLPSIRVPEYIQTYSRVVKNIVNIWFDQEHIHRFQSICKNDQLHCRWMEFLGFKKESVMQRFGGEREDYAMFVRLK